MSIYFGFVQHLKELVEEQKGVYINSEAVSRVTFYISKEDRKLKIDVREINSASGSEVRQEKLVYEGGGYLADESNFRAIGLSVSTWVDFKFLSEKSREPSQSHRVYIYRCERLNIENESFKLDSIEFKGPDLSVSLN